MTNLEPPRPLTIAARQTWDRISTRIQGEGRWQIVDQDLLAVYAETLELYLQLKADIDRDGSLVQGRSAQERVRHPSLMGCAACRTDLIRLSRAIPLIDPHPDVDGIETDRLLEMYK